MFSSPNSCILHQHTWTNHTTQLIQWTLRHVNQPLWNFAASHLGKQTFHMLKIWKIYSVFNCTKVQAGSERNTTLQARSAELLPDKLTARMPFCRLFSIWDFSRFLAPWFILVIIISEFLLKTTALYLKERTALMAVKEIVWTDFTWKMSSQISTDLLPFLQALRFHLHFLLLVCLEVIFRLIINTMRSVFSLVFQGEHSRCRNTRCSKVRQRTQDDPSDHNSHRTKWDTWHTNEGRGRSCCLRSRFGRRRWMRVPTTYSLDLRASREGLLWCLWAFFVSARLERTQSLASHTLHLGQEGEETRHVSGQVDGVNFPIYQRWTWTV